MSITHDVSGYCPISVKDEMNMPSVNYLGELTNSEIFLSKKNIHYMTYHIIALSNMNKTGADTTKLAKTIPNMMIEWARKEDLNDFEYIYPNVLLILGFLNEKFLGSHSSIYDRVDLTARNVFRIKDRVTVDACGNQELKRYEEMTAADYQNIDVYQDQQTYTYDALNRYKNKFPIWQYSMSSRPYDLSNDGLHTSNPDRASLDMQVRGYDMSNIIKGSNNYETNPYYEHI